MKTKLQYIFILLCVLSGSFLGGLNAQSYITESDYDLLKKEGSLVIDSVYSILPNVNSSRQSARYTPPDASYVLAIPPSDDGSSPLITLPFNFCLEGQDYRDVFINTNGNISFDQPFSSGTPFNFPFVGFKIIAPFWADGDTRVRGEVYYKLLPNALIVNWLDIGHYDSNDTRGNSFQLIITDGSSDLLPFGYTVGFFYDEMEWTSGDASGGVNGFGGAPAIVGLNVGDGFNSSLIGKFDNNTDIFSPSVDSINGVKWLTDQHVFLNPCDSINNDPALMGYKLKDTIGVCVGDTARETYYFPAPEDSQEVYVVVDVNGSQDFTVTNTTIGHIASADLEIAGSVSNMGFHTISFTVLDNGNPARLLEYDLVVQVDSLPQPLQVYGDTLICSNTTTVLSVDTVYQEYIWSTGNRTPSIVAEPGSYSVLVSYNNCEATQNKVVQPYIPNAHISGLDLICLPDTLTLSAPVNDAYIWSTGDTTASINISQPGVYYVTVTDQQCIEIDSFLVDTIGPNTVKINASNMNTCNLDTVRLQVENLFDSVLWSTGDTNIMINVQSGLYTVYVQLNSGSSNVCVGTDTISIGSVVFPSVTVSGDSLICGDNFTLFQVDSVYSSYYWDNEVTSQFASINSPGLHSVTITESTCQDSTSFTVNQNPLPNVSIGGSLFYCDDVDSALLVSLGGPFDSIYWSTGEVTDTIYTGFGWKYLTAWQDGCEITVNHPVNELINGVDVHGITEICPNQSTQLSVEFGFDFYQWNTGAIGFSTLASTPGQYWCVVSLDTCSATTDTVTVTLNQPDTAEIFGDTVMCDSTKGFIYIDLNYQQYVWSTGESTPGIHYTTPGVYSVTVEDSGYCITSDTINIQVKPSPTVQITGDGHYCFNDSTQLSAGNFETYFWSNRLITPQVLVPVGTYAVTVMASNGCFAENDGFLVTSSSPEAKILGDSAICAKGEGQLFTVVDTLETFRWSTGAISDTITVTLGTYELFVTDTHNCTAVDTFEMPSLPSPVAGILVNPSGISYAYSPIFFQDNSELTNVEVSHWFWSFNDSIISLSRDTTLSFYKGMMVEVVHAVTGDNGCTDTTSIQYEISGDIVKVNVITPNGDGVNDYLSFPNLPLFNTNRLIILNRWGAVIEEIEDYRNYWDAYGMPDGTYFYLLYLGDEAEPIKGSFTIFR